MMLKACISTRQIGDECCYFSEISKANQINRCILNKCVSKRYIGKFEVAHDKLVLNAVLKLSTVKDARIILTFVEEIKLLDALAIQVFDNYTF